LLQALIVGAVVLAWALLLLLLLCYVLASSGTATQLLGKC
jgi:hypothetical protein